MTALSRSSYSEHEIDTALIAYFTLGTFKKACAETGVPLKTLHRWVTETHADRYKQLAEEQGHILERHLTDSMLRMADNATQGTGEALDSTRSFIQAGMFKEAAAMSTAARNLSTVVGIATDKRLSLTGRPTSYVQHLSAEDAIQGIARMAGITLEGTAEDVTDAETRETREPTALQAQTDNTNAREQG